MTTELPEPKYYLARNGRLLETDGDIDRTGMTPEIYTREQMLAMRDAALEEAAGKAHIALLGCDRDLTARVVTAINSLKEVQS